MDNRRRKSQSVKIASVKSQPEEEGFSRISLSGPIPHSVLNRRSLRMKKTPRALPAFAGFWLVLAFLALVTSSGLQFGGHFEIWRKTQGSLADFTARLIGFDIARVQMSGHSQLSETEILAFAGISTKNSLLFLDAEEARRRLESVPLIGKASIRKLYPDGLAITVIERDAHALWQRDGELSVISLDGAVIDRLQDERFQSLPHVVGEGANLRTREYLALLEHAGPLRARILAGTLVSGRRWTLKLDNGIDIRLPEAAPAEALRRLVALETSAKVLSRDIIAIDLRMPDRVVVRLTEEAMSQRLEMMKKRPQRGKGGVET
jgi:cell division protein FtsQ